MVGAMPDADGFPTPDEIINTPASDMSPKPVPSPAPTLPPGFVQPTPEQRKALGIILSGVPYVLVGCRETHGDPDSPEVSTGCDFLTCLEGSPEILRAVKPHLPDVIDRLYEKNGLL